MHGCTCRGYLLGAFLVGSFMLFATDVARADTGDARTELSAAVPIADFSELSLEGLLQDLQVTTSGKQSMKMSEVPESIWVLTADEIRRSGVTSTAELLRLIPGMDVSQLSPGHYEVSARYHENIMGNKLLLLVDSRPTYINSYRTNLWSALPVVLEEIERIEVIYGPGSTLYGTSAFTGIVNIITKTPEKRAARLSASIGPQLASNRTSWDNAYVGGTWSDAWGPVTTRLSASYQRTPSWNDSHYRNSSNPDPADNNTAVFQPMWEAVGNAVAHWQINSDLALTVRGGVNKGVGDYMPIYREQYHLLGFYADGQFTAENLAKHGDYFELRLYYRDNDYRVPIVFLLGLPAVDLAMHERSSVLSSMYRITLFDRFTTSVGIEAEQQDFSSPILYPDVRQVRFISGFVQEKVHILDNLTAIAGVRAEGMLPTHTPVTGSTIPVTNKSLVVPKGSLVYSPVPGHTLRASIGQGFQYPSLIQAYSDFSVYNGLIHIMRGNADLNPVSVTTYELGYQYSLAHLLTLKCDLFYAVMHNQVEFVADDTGQAQFILANQKQTTPYYGGELAATIVPLSWLSVKAAYALQFQKELYRFDNPPIPPNPVHKAYLSLSANPIQNLDVDLHTYFASFWQGTANNLPAQTVNPVILLNLRVAYHVLPELSIALSGYNLLNKLWGKTFQASGTDAETFVPDADVVGRRIMLTVEAEL
jgi:iron complex outermembrane recepter protein